MSTQREWKPGDVGVAPIGGRFLVVSSGRCAWATLGGDYVVSGRPEATDRPLVVIDPEDRDQAVRLTEAFYAAGYDIPNEGDPHHYDRMQAALRELANPAPPKPDEPKGLGAVVEDETGIRWVRAAQAGDPWRPTSGPANWREYGLIKAVRVLSEGVTDAD